MRSSFFNRIIASALLVSMSAGVGAAARAEQSYQEMNNEAAREMARALDKIPGSPLSVTHELMELLAQMGWQFTDITVSNHVAEFKIRLPEVISKDLYLTGRITPDTKHGRIYCDLIPHGYFESAGSGKRTLASASFWISTDSALHERNAIDERLTIENQLALLTNGILSLNTGKRVKIDLRPGLTRAISGAVMIAAGTVLTFNSLRKVPTIAQVTTWQGATIFMVPGALGLVLLGYGIKNLKQGMRMLKKAPLADTADPRNEAQTVITAAIEKFNDSLGSAISGLMDIDTGTITETEK